MSNINFNDLINNVINDMNKDEEMIVVKGDKLLLAKSKYEYSRFEHILIISGIRKIPVGFEGSPVIELQLDKIYELAYMSKLSGTTKVEMINKLKKLTKKTIIIDDNVEVSWLKHFSYNSKLKTCKIQFNDSIFPYLRTVYK